MTELIESAVSLQAVAKAIKTTAAAVEADARDLNLYVGHAWDGQRALSVRDAHAYVSGDARRDADHAAAHGHWRAASEAWVDQREACRRTAYNAHFDTARRRGVGDPQAAHEAAQAASAAVESYENATPAPVFGDAESSRLSMRKRVKAVVQR